ncbi:ribbon-helix-helix domain-containing protein [Streptomyces alanosinicus]|uniref:Ribbon-helix-helix protein CopG domain-containing protein n=1 Tax=Streptomyces alanosinicus TaxID=68171 RepID=A0A918YMX8_9ACTN|nr:hypothetical protein GCM10010339_57680 [Streptomyces alanosinicus]
MLKAKHMVRTQIYLPRSLYDRIQLRAEREHTSMGQVIRELLEDKVFHRKPRETAGDALLRLAKLGEKLRFHGPADLSTRLDDYLYGEQK